MSARIDHAAEAQRLIESVYSDDPAILDGIRAVVHAQLALVEQQRIANRIALASVVAEASRAAGVHGSVLGLIVKDVGLFGNPSKPEGVPPLDDDIREGLGL